MGRDKNPNAGRERQAVVDAHNAQAQREKDFMFERLTGVKRGSVPTLMGESSAAQTFARDSANESASLAKKKKEQELKAARVQNRSMPSEDSVSKKTLLGV